MFFALKQIFSKVKYITIAVVLAAIVFIFIVWLPNLSLVKEIIFGSNISIGLKIKFLISLLGAIKTNSSTVSFISTIVISLLFGLNISILSYYINKRKTKKRIISSLSLGGLISGIFGIGCASCGTFLLTSFLSLIGASSFLALLPFGGEEFSFLGIFLLIYSSYSILKKINDPLICDR